MIIKITKNELHLLQPIALVAQVLISEEMYQPEYLAWVESSSMDLVKLADLGAERIIVKSKVTSLPEERVGLLSKDGIVASGVKFRFVDTLDIDGSDNVIVPASLFAAANDPLLCFCQFYFRNLKSDRPDGLFPTIVVNEQQVALGLCYSSLESILESLRTRSGVYFSRKRGLWHKGKTSGAIQTLIRISVDCDVDTLRFIVCQQGAGFCHLDTSTCFGSLLGINALFQTLSQRFVNAPAGSYTKRLFDDSDMLDSKIREEADELCTAHTSNEVAWEAADLIYFAAAKCVSKGVTWTDIEANLNLKSKKLTRRPGDVKPKYTAQTEPNVKRIKVEDDAGDFTLNVFNADELSEKDYNALLKRPIINTAKIMEVVHPIVNNVKANGDAAVKDYTKKFDQVDLTDIVIDAPFNSQLMELDETVKNAIDVAYSNIWKFHEAQLENSPLIVETMPGITCTRFFRPIEKVGLYVPGGTAILPSSTLMLGIPAKVAGCKEIIIATPPRKDGRVSPEVVYVAHLVGASKILLAGGAQAVAAMAYGTESIPKVDKICGPGNQYVTAAKMICQSDSAALLSIDMPAGPSELLVVANATSNLEYVAADLLSQAEHGVDSQVVLVAVGFDEKMHETLKQALYSQATRLPRCEIVRESLKKSFILNVKSMEHAIEFSNSYAPEHLILSIENAQSYLEGIKNAGSVFLGLYAAESCGDYASGTNHTLPTYGYARMYSGVNTHSFVKHITSQEITKEGLKNIGTVVETLASIEGLEAHKNAVTIRLKDIRDY